MSRLKQRIDQLYRTVFDDFVPRREVSAEELATLDAVHAELVLRTVHATEYGRRSSPWSVAQRLELLNLFRGWQGLAPCTALPDVWPDLETEFEELLASVTTPQADGAR